VKTRCPAPPRPRATHKRVAIIRVADEPVNPPRQMSAQWRAAPNVGTVASSTRIKPGERSNASRSLRAPARRPRPRSGYPGPRTDQGPLTHSSSRESSVIYTHERLSPLIFLRASCRKSPESERPSVCMRAAIARPADTTSARPAQVIGAMLDAADLALAHQMRQGASNGAL
jgi:hypothetical protein